MVPHLAVALTLILNNPASGACVNTDTGPAFFFPPVTLLAVPLDYAVPYPSTTVNRTRRAQCIAVVECDFFLLSSCYVKYFLYLCM